MEGASQPPAWANDTWAQPPATPQTPAYPSLYAPQGAPPPYTPPANPPGYAPQGTPPFDVRRYGPAGPVPWTFRQTVIGLALTLIPWLALSIGALIIAPKATSTPQHAVAPALDIATGVVTFVVSALIEGAFLLAPAYYALVRRTPGLPFRQRLSALGFRRTPLLPAMGFAVSGVVVALVASAAYSEIVIALKAPLQTNADQLMREAGYAPFTTLGVLAAAVLVAPFCEEVFFRGFGFAGLLQRMSLWPAVIVSALIFAVAHADIGSFAPLLIIGLILAYTRWRTGSIWPGMVIHALNNGVAALFILPLIFH